AGAADTRNSWWGGGGGAPPATALHHTPGGNIPAPTRAALIINWRIEMSFENKQVVSREEWIEARRALLAKKKEFTRRRDDLNRQRRELPWVKIEKEYVFDAPEGKVTLAELFGGRSQLFIKHFMM